MKKEVEDSIKRLGITLGFSLGELDEQVTLEEMEDFYVEHEFDIEQHLSNAFPQFDECDKIEYIQHSFGEASMTQKKYRQRAAELFIYTQSSPP